ncbi:hypothetical protein PRZ48_009052 [Zasmidium cellare]|uniref:Ig-like domain-containing protein n=1 Tax=Zasmidium cellare TaxID=395010 RepID=A0ABR0EHW2_ZASCE|nr:hypothetical protein PRZ48_009052 [Zasmidium cellare]
MLTFLFALAGLSALHQALALPASNGSVPVNVDPVTGCFKHTVLVGDGDPHQNYFNIQVTENLDCGQGGTGCSVSHLNSHTLMWSVNPGVIIDEWITGGFAVGESYTTGDTYTCDAAPGQTVCVWSKIAYTAYTVHNGQSGPNCGGSIDTSPFVLKSPNSGDAGSYYCVYGSACRSDGQGYWDDTGRAGGP